MRSMPHTLPHCGKLIDNDSVGFFSLLVVPSVTSLLVTFGIRSFVARTSIGIGVVAAVASARWAIALLRTSIRLAIAHLLASTRDIRPLFFAAARPMKVEW